MYEKIFIDLQNEDAAIDSFSKIIRSQEVKNNFYEEGNKKVDKSYYKNDICGHYILKIERFIANNKDS